MLEELKYNSLVNICHRICATIVSLVDKVILEFFLASLCFVGLHVWFLLRDDMEGKKRFLSTLPELEGGVPKFVSLFIQEVQFWSIKGRRRGGRAQRGGRPCPNFWSHFQELHFWSIKEPIIYSKYSIFSSEQSLKS